MPWWSCRMSWLLLSGGWTRPSGAVLVWTIPSSYANCATRALAISAVFVAPEWSDSSQESDFATTCFQSACINSSQSCFCMICFCTFWKYLPLLPHWGFGQSPHNLGNDFLVGLLGGMESGLLLATQEDFNSGSEMLIAWLCIHQWQCTADCEGAKQTN